MENLTKKTKIPKLMINKIKIKLENSRRSWKTFQNFNKRRAFNKAVGPRKKSKINKPRAYLYSGLKSILLAQITQYYGLFYIYGHFPIQYIFYGHFTLWTFSDSSNLYGHFITMDNLPYGFFTHRSS